MNMQKNVDLAAFQNGSGDSVPAPADALPPIRYLEGHPRQYGFDTATGVFSLNQAGPLGRSLTIQPIGWRIFTDNILHRGTRRWAELFFIDQQQCVATILFQDGSVARLARLLEPLYYDDLTLADVLLNMVAERRDHAPADDRYVAHFGMTPADPARTLALKHYAQTHRIFRHETRTEQYTDQLA
jgi:hypothetical protein